MISLHFYAGLLLLESIYLRAAFYYALSLIVVPCFVFIAIKAVILSRC